MKTKNKALLAGPFLVWTVAFIVDSTPHGDLLRLHRRMTEALPLKMSSGSWPPSYLKSLWLALLLSLVSTVACLVMSYPLAMILSKLKGKQEPASSS